jgi:maltose alpha-D-glucosyltransferase/alpha-amylase
VWCGAEIGMGDDLSLPERNSVRRPMQWSDERNAGFSTAASENLVRPVVEGRFDRRVNVAAQHDPSGSLMERAAADAHVARMSRDRLGRGGGFGNGRERRPRVARPWLEEVDRLRPIFCHKRLAGDSRRRGAGRARSLWLRWLRAHGERRQIIFRRSGSGSPKKMRLHKSWSRFHVSGNGSKAAHVEQAGRISAGRPL